MQFTQVQSNMPKKFRELLFQIGLVLGAVVLGRLLDSPVSYCIAAVLTIAFITQWLLQRDEQQRDNELEGLFGGPIPWAETRKAELSNDPPQPSHIGKPFNWHKEWTRIGADFRRIDDRRIFAECGPDYRGEQEIWQIRAETENVDTQDCRTLCELAGSALTRSYPEIPISENVRSQTQHSVRWLCYLRETEPEQFSLHKYYMTVKGKPINRDGGVIEHLTKVSANACKKCRGATYPITQRPS